MRNQGIDTLMIHYYDETIILPDSPITPVTGDYITFYNNAGECKYGVIRSSEMDFTQGVLHLNIEAI